MTTRKLTDEQKADNKVWRWLGYQHTIGFIDKKLQARLQYKKAGKYILVEDFDMILPYAPIRQSNLDRSGLGFTLATFEAWLQEKGVERVAQKRYKRSYSLYD